MDNLREVLEHYGVYGEVVATNYGPLVTQIEFLPQAGTKIKNITSSIDDIARELGTPSLRVDIVEENGTIGFEIPAIEMKTVDFSNMLQSEEFLNTTYTLPIILGSDIKGRATITDLAKMPHMLVAGTTGSGKSVGLNTFILSLIAKHKPADLKFVLIDPKRIEFGIYNKQKYMLTPVITEMSEASDILSFLVEEMERRYSLLEENLVKNISEYNESIGHLPYIVCIIDEFADLMASNKDVEAYVQRLAQKARAAGIHIILATQRPSVDVVTGILKANFPTRLAYKTASSADSRTIIDTTGAEKLIGRGDALFLAADGNLKRVHGAYMPDEKIAEMLEPFRGEIKKIYTKKQDDNNIVASKTNKSFFRKIWDFWTSLRQKDRKIIINTISFIIGYLTGSKKRRR